MDLSLNPDDLNRCIQCGLCLPHCPTYRVTGDELLSPRGRIRLMAEVHNGDAPLTDEVVDAFSTCIQCRGCEPACPSGVPYGTLIERTQEALVNDNAIPSRLIRAGLWFLTRPRLLRALSSVLAVIAPTRIIPARFGVPTALPVRRQPLVSSGSDVFLFTGCVMDAWQRDVHQATQRVLEAAGVGVEPTGDAAPCCGALHHHAGLRETARGRAEATMAALGRDGRPILVNSAGCGAALKDYGRLLGTDDAREFSARVFDVQEWLAQHGDQLPVAPRLPLTVAVQDPCHLRHVQRAHGATRQVLAPFVSELVELNDDGLCCGAGGAFAVRQPELADTVRRRKLEVIAGSRADLVASANPGCALHLRAGGAVVHHPMQIVDWALHGGIPASLTAH